MKAFVYLVQFANGDTFLTYSAAEAKAAIAYEKKNARKCILHTYKLEKSEAQNE